jgi:hypothetical protein
MNFIHVSLGTSLEKMPSTFTKFLAWLIDDKSFEKANEPHVMSVFAINSFGVKIDIIGTFLYQAPAFLH